MSGSTIFDLLYKIADVLLTIVFWAVLIRALLSWFYPVGKDAFTRVLVELTEPILAPIRSVLSRILPIPIDFSPMVAWLLISFLQSMLRNAYRGF
jgi:YggT family protein